MAKQTDKSNARAARLARAKSDRTLIRFSRPFEDGSVNGYVLDIGSKYFMIALLSDDIWLNGFQCFRIKDVRRLQVPHPNERFAEAALDKRGERVGGTPPVDLGDIASIVRSAGQAFPLVVLHREEVKPGSCWIGRVVDVTDDNVSLLEIGPDAQWDKKPTKYSLKEITQVSFGADYEDALHLVGGDR